MGRKGGTFGGAKGDVGVKGHLACDSQAMLLRNEKTQGASMLGEYFDPKSDLHIYEHCRPHWSQAGSVVFITFRTHDSIPREVLDRWEREKQEWLRQKGCDPTRHWSELVPTLADKCQMDFYKHFNRCREEFLDSCHGRCLLK